MSDKYVLRGHDVVPVDDLLTWAFEFEKCDRIVRQEHLGDYEISTIFCGLDMNLHRLITGRGKPLLFETMVFSGFHRAGEIIAQERCSTWDEAEEQHARMVARVAQMVNS